MNLNSEENTNYVKYIKILGNHILDSDFPISVLEEFKERYDFCMEELDFWKSRNNPNRFKKSLHDLLKWLYITMHDRH